MEYGASCEDVARVCHAHPVSSISFCYIRKFSSRKASSLYICLQDRRIISFSVVNITEKLRCCQLDLGHFFSMIGKNSLIWQKILSFLYAIQLHCLFGDIRIIFDPLTIANFQLCLLLKMRLSVDLEGRYTGYKTQQKD